MDAFSYVFFGLFGLIAGSFLNVVALRVPAGESVLKPRSRCPGCLKTLTPLQLVPVASYLILRGRCRYCGTSLPLYYPLTEAGTAVLFVLAYGRWGWSLELLAALPLLSILVVITHTDLRLKLIPDKVTIPGMVYFCLLRLFVRSDPWWEYALGFVVAGGLLMLIAVLSRGGMGGGDIKLMAMAGLAIGWKYALFAFMMATLLGGLVGIGLLLLKRAGRRDAIAFGPFLAIGIAASYMWGDVLWHWYWNEGLI